MLCSVCRVCSDLGLSVVGSKLCLVLLVCSLLCGWYSIVMWLVCENGLFIVMVGRL